MLFSQWPGIAHALVSSLRVLEGMGDAGRQMAKLLYTTRTWSQQRFGQAQADMANAFREMKTADNFEMFTKAL